MSLQSRYIELLKSSLLNLPYLENEVRLLYLAATLATGGVPDAAVVREIRARLPALVRQVEQAREEGRPWWVLSMDAGNGVQRQYDFRDWCQFSHTMIGRQRMDNIVRCLDAIRTQSVPGDLIEAGAWRGGATILMRGYLAAWEIHDRTVWVADSFAGLPKPTLTQDAGHDFSAEIEPILAVSLDEVQDNFRRYGLLDGQVRFLKGWFAQTLPAAPIERLALLRLDGDLYESTMDALDALYAKVVPGGFVIVDDYGDFEPCRRAVDDFRARHGVGETLFRIDWSGVFWRRESS